MNKVIQGDCLEVLREIPDSSVDLICTDPPYFKVKKDWWDRQWAKPECFLKWLDSIAEQWQRVLKPNGSLYCFASPKMAARVEVMLGDRFNVLNHLVWDKSLTPTHALKYGDDRFRFFIQKTERIIFCEQYGADNASNNAESNIARCMVFGNYLKSEILRSGVSNTEIAKLFPSKNGNLTGWLSNKISGLQRPTNEQYLAIRNYLNASTGTNDYCLRTYEDLHREYEELRRPFAVTADVPYTDVWTFPTVSHYPGKHPCEKPAELLEHIIKASSRPGAVVLDSFAGSGSTLLAAKKLGRDYIGIEIDPHWVNMINQRLGDFEYAPIAIPPPQKPKSTEKTSESQQLSLF